ncbi:MAG: SUMF1/EgtB/PvdO family nonheme iron enzyme [Myxococcales bacterium]|nr:SUMF1/EgtB/PvdO family nonheme iron enzyme [Myxococcales bacterium]MCB9643461.1 SUMF1/EgtB/PvdO family nonheme iron enzyme [Myxococcales bacterium]
MKTQDILQSLKQLGELRAQGVLSEEEFSKEKAALMELLQQSRRLAGAYPEAASSASPKKEADKAPVPQDTPEAARTTNHPAAMAADMFATGFVGQTPVAPPQEDISFQRPSAPAAPVAADMFATGFADVSDPSVGSGSAMTASPSSVGAAAAEAADFFATGGAAPAQGGVTMHLEGPSQTTIDPLIAGRYRRMGELGRGGMGAVLRVLDTQVSEERALKTLHDGLPQMREMFTREFQALQRLRHPHIVRLFELGRDPQVGFFFTMEMLQGEDLQRVLERAKKSEKRPLLEPSSLIDWVSQVAEALEAAHNQGLLHLDLKPANIFLCEDGVRLIDFGIAQMRAVVSGQPTMGTVYYMAPEQLSGDAPLSPATDIYALGVVVYQMLTGKIFQGGMPGPSQIDASLPRALDQVHEKATCWPPEDRFQKPTAFAEALRRALQEPVTLVEPPKEDVASRRAAFFQQGGSPARSGAPRAKAAGPSVVVTAPVEEVVSTWPSTHWTELRKLMDRKRPRWLQTPFSRKPPQLALASSFSEEELHHLPVAPLDGAILVLDKSGAPLFELCGVSGGTYTVGAEKRDKQARRSEKPYQKVQLSGYWIGRTTITGLVWQRFLEESGYEPDRQERHVDYMHGWTGRICPNGREDHPITHLSVNHVWAFCDFYGLSLPSEAQWEAAMRGPKALLYPWGERPPQSREHGPSAVADIGRSMHRTSLVYAHLEGTSPFGLLEGIGNVRQWVADAYDAGWLQQLKEKDPVIPSLDRAQFVSTRGAASDQKTDFAQTYRRSHEPPDACLASVGFRVCLDMDAFGK